MGSPAGYGAPVRQQLLDATVREGGQPREHVLEVEAQATDFAVEQEVAERRPAVQAVVDACVPPMLYRSWPGLRFRGSAPRSGRRVRAGTPGSRRLPIARTF